MYEGTFLDGYKFGAGILYTTNYAVSSFVKGNEITGTINYADGAVYIGMLHNNVPNGFGQLLFCTEVYSGYFSSGKRHGKGI